jgi:hypothetical protein
LFFLYVAARGSGMLSLDSLWRKRAASHGESAGVRVATTN